MRDIKERYAASSLGALWSFIYPIVFILTYWFVFSKIMHAKGITTDIPYLPFLLSGLFPWFAIQEGIIRGSSSILEKGYIIKKMPIPNEIFPISSNIAAFFHNSIGFFMFLLIYFTLYRAPSLTTLLILPILAIAQLVFSLGCSLLLSAFTVYFRDITQVINIAFQGLFFLSPILYPISAIPEKFRPFLQLNPAAHLLESYRAVIIYNRIPDLSSMLYFVAVSASITATGYFVFNRLKDGFSDTL